MFGYVSANPQMMSEQDIQRYRSWYCGLCRTLGRRQGQLSRLSLTYDMTFLGMFLSAMYEPEEDSELFWCVVHPKGKHTAVTTKYLDYAADMNVLLAYLNCLDNWQDDHSVVGLGESLVFKKGYSDAVARYPRQAAVIAEELKRLNDLEAEKCGNPDLVANCFGRLLAELFVFDENDHFASDLRQFGFYLGKFIYLYDAVMDYDEDRKKSRYNPLLHHYPKGVTPEEARGILTAYVSVCVEIFERLPILQDNDIIRNILYVGVWQSFEKRFGQLQTGSKDE